MVIFPDSSYIKKKGKYMDKIEGFDVEIEYGEKEMIDCLSDFLILLKENCEKSETEIEIASPLV